MWGSNRRTMGGEADVQRNLLQQRYLKFEDHRRAIDYKRYLTRAKIKLTPAIDRTCPNLNHAPTTTLPHLSAPRRQPRRNRNPRLTVCSGVSLDHNVCHLHERRQHSHRTRPTRSCHTTTKPVFIHEHQCPYSIGQGKQDRRSTPWLWIPVRICGILAPNVE